MIIEGMIDQSLAQDQQYTNEQLNQNTQLNKLKNFQDQADFTQPSGARPSLQNSHSQQPPSINQTTANAASTSKITDSITSINQPKPSLIAPGMYKPIPEQIFYQFETVSRPFQPRKKSFFVNVTIIGLLFSLILFFIGQLITVAVILSLMFLVYILSVIPPHLIKIKISNYGVYLDQNFYLWEELDNFWWQEKNNIRSLIIECVRFPGRIYIVVPQEHQEIVQLLLTEVLAEHQPMPTTFEKIGQWLEEKFPLEL